jgi:hypothetical protein
MPLPPIVLDPQRRRFAVAKGSTIHEVWFAVLA